MAYRRSEHCRDGASFDNTVGQGSDRLAKLKVAIWPARIREFHVFDSFRSIRGWRGGRRLIFVGLQVLPATQPHDSAPNERKAEDKEKVDLPAFAHIPHGPGFHPRSPPANYPKDSYGNTYHLT